MILKDAIPPTEENHYWEMFQIDVIKWICYAVKAQKVTVWDIKDSS